MDIVAPLGTPVRAPAAGVVAFVHPDMYFNGATVLLDHGHGLTSTYVHLYRILVRENQWVDRGEIIGEVGASGRPRDRTCISAWTGTRAGSVRSCWSGSCPVPLRKAAQLASGTGCEYHKTLRGGGRAACNPVRRGSGAFFCVD